MKTFAIIVIILMPSTAVIAQKCKYIVDKVDDFTGAKIKETTQKMFVKKGIGLSTYSSISTKRSNDTKILVYRFTHHNIYTLNESDGVSFKFDDEEIIKLPFTKTEIANPNNISGKTYWQTMQYLLLSDAFINSIL